MEHSTQNHSEKPHLVLRNEADSLVVGAALAPHLRSGDCVLLTGDLGAGKTTFVRGLLNGVARQTGLESLDVPSPTFTLVQLYQFAGTMFYHYDLYRLPEDDDNEMSLTEIGFFDSLTDGVALVEWPQRLGHCVPTDALHLDLSLGADDIRVLTWYGTGLWAERAFPLFSDVTDHTV